jgi:beta-lactamase regulating signal transducer with metallopeptidase domain/multidrug efflux pump subunit AcrA (membrane-fusion protein)
MIDVLGPPSSWTRALLALGIDVALKAAALGLLAFLLHRLLGRRRPLVRSVLWNACLIGLLLLPASAAVFPRFSITCLPETSAVTSPARLDPVAMEGPEIPAPSLVVVAPQPVQPAKTRFDLSLTIVMLYFSVAAMLALRLLVSLAAVRRLRRTSLPVELHAWVEALERWRMRLELRRPVLLVRSGRVDVPMVIGGYRSVIVLPESLAGAANKKTIDAVILHELAHVRRGDYGWNLVLHVVQILYWPHPVAWFLGRVIGSVREQACDDLCIYWMGNAGDYRATLLDVASGLVRRRPWQALGLAMARSSKLGRRIAQIDRSPGTSRCLLRWPARVGIVLAIIAACGVLGSVKLARRAAAAQAQEPASKPAEGEKKGDTEDPRPQEDPPKAKVPSSQPPPPGEPPVRVEGEEASLQKVRTIHPKRMDFSVETTHPCSLKTFEPASVHARISGVVRAKNLAQVGERVEAGQVLAELDATELAVEFERVSALQAQSMSRQQQAEATIKVAQAALNGNKAKYQEAQLAFAKAQKTLRYREQALAQVTRLRDQGAISREEIDKANEKFDDAKSALETANTGINSAKAAIDQGEAELSRAKAALAAEKISVRLAEVDHERVQNQMNQAKVIAPIAGVVISRNVEPDALVRPDQAKPLFVIARTDKLTAVTFLPESDVPLIDPGDPVRVHVAGLSLEGKVTRTAYELDPSTRTLRVEMDLVNPNGKLRPGMSGQVTIVLETHPNALVIPGSVLLRDQFGFGASRCVRVVNGRTVNTPVKLGRANYQFWEVLEGLNESDELIDLLERNQPRVLPQQPAFTDGTRVEVLPSPPEKAP